MKVFPLELSDWGRDNEHDSRNRGSSGSGWCPHDVILKLREASGFVADDSESDVRSEGGVPVTASAPQVGGWRNRGVAVRRALLGTIGACLAMAIGLAGWLYWTHPTTTTASLPDRAQRGEEEYLSGALPPPETIHGTLYSGPLHSRNHEWIGTVTWQPRHAAEQDYEIRLGESVHIEGIGTVTLLEVAPPPAIPEINFFRDRSAGGWKYRVNITLDPGLSLCTKRNPCTQK